MAFQAFDSMLSQTNSTFPVNGPWSSNVRNSAAVLCIIKGGYQTFKNNLMFIKLVSVILAHIPGQYTASFTPTVTEAELPMLTPPAQKYRLVTR